MVDMQRVKFIMGEPAKSMSKSPEPPMTAPTNPSNPAPAAGTGRLGIKRVFQLEKAALKNPNILAKSKLIPTQVHCESPETTEQSVRASLRKKLSKINELVGSNGEAVEPEDASMP